MRCNKLTWIYLTLFLFLTIQFVYATTNWHFPKNINIPSGKKWHFGDCWVQSIGTSIKITAYFENNWFNYSSTGGTQNIHNNTKPYAVYFNNIEQIEGDTWTYGAGTTTITPTGTNVSILWGPQILATHTYATNYLVYGVNIRIYFLSNTALAFQNDVDETVSLEITSGLLNSTSNAIKVDTGGGYFHFTAINDTQITITHEGIDQVYVSGDQNNSNRMIASDTSITIDANNYVRISWRFLPWSLIDNYFMLGVGLTGIVMLIAGPTWFARTYIKHGLDTDTIEHLGYGMLMMIMGFGFVVVWLWPG